MKRMLVLAFAFAPVTVLPGVISIHYEGDPDTKVYKKAMKPFPAELQKNPSIETLTPGYCRRFFAKVEGKYSTYYCEFQEDKDIKVIVQSEGNKGNQITGWFYADFEDIDFSTPWWKKLFCCFYLKEGYQDEYCCECCCDMYHQLCGRGARDCLRRVLR